MRVICTITRANRGISIRVRALSNFILSITPMLLKERSRHHRSNRIHDTAARVQIAILSERINTLTGISVHKKDGLRTGLFKMIGSAAI